MAQSYETERDRLLRLLWTATPRTIDAHNLALQARAFRRAQEQGQQP